MALPLLPPSSFTYCVLPWPLDNPFTDEKVTVKGGTMLVPKATEHERAGFPTLLAPSPPGCLASAASFLCPLPLPSPNFLWPHPGLLFCLPLPCLLSFPLSLLFLFFFWKFSDPTCCSCCGHHGDNIEKTHQQRVMTRHSVCECCLNPRLCTKSAQGLTSPSNPRRWMAV